MTTYMTTPIPFLIVGTHRTGSSAFAEQLGLHPDIACGWESVTRLAPWRRIAAATRILHGDYSDLRDTERRFLESTQNPLAIGFRLLFRASPRWLWSPATGPAVWFEQLFGHLRSISRYPELRLLHLVRRDNLAWLRSLALARQSGSYAGAPYPPGLVARMSPMEAVRRVRSKHFLGAHLHALSATNRYLLVDYEKFDADNAAVIDDAVKFLGLEARREAAPGPRLKPQSTARHTFRRAARLEAALGSAGLRRDPTGLTPGD